MGLKGYRLWVMGQLDSTCRAPPRELRLVGDDAERRRDVTRPRAGVLLCTPGSDVRLVTCVRCHQLSVFSLQNNAVKSPNPTAAWCSVVRPLTNSTTRESPAASRSVKWWLMWRRDVLVG
jgi:hypothetical protein